MRGRSSSTKARLRSAGYRCNLCGRRLIDAATLERHQKSIHNVTLRGNTSFKPKPPAQKKPKEREKILSDFRKEHTWEQYSLKSKNNNQNLNNTQVNDTAAEGQIVIEKKINEISENVSVENIDKSTIKNNPDSKTHPVIFECPRCARVFSVYFNAHKHIQKTHSKDNELAKLLPIRLELCYRCDSRIRSDQEHLCPKDSEVQYMCSGCNHIIASVKSFDMHVSGMHSDRVDSMLFPTKVEFMTWRLEMERQTNAKYSLYGEYESKKVYRCNYTKRDLTPENQTIYLCPSSMVVQEFPIGIQVHYCSEHFDHPAISYTLSSKYKKYSITSIFRSTEERLLPTACSTILDDKELYPLFKKLMDGIVINAAKVDAFVLKDLIKKALELSVIVTEAVVRENPFPTKGMSKGTKHMSDKEITEELEIKLEEEEVQQPKPAKRMRNKSPCNQSPTGLSPKIVNTFSLASNCNTEETKLDNSDDIDSTKSDNSEKVKSSENKTTKSDLVTKKYTKMNTRLSSLSDLSFNDSYKDFIDKNFIAKSDSKPIKNI